jgi:hypothetical protein
LSKVSTSWGHAKLETIRYLTPRTRSMEAKCRHTAAPAGVTGDRFDSKLRDREGLRTAVVSSV